MKYHPADKALNLWIVSHLIPLQLQGGLSEAH